MRGSSPGWCRNAILEYVDKPGPGAGQHGHAYTPLLGCAALAAQQNRSPHNDPGYAAEPEPMVLGSRVSAGDGSAPFFYPAVWYAHRVPVPLYQSATVSRYPRVPLSIRPRDRNSHYISVLGSIQVCVIHIYPTLPPMVHFARLY